MYDDEYEDEYLMDREEQKKLNKYIGMKLNDKLVQEIEKVFSPNKISINYFSGNVRVEEVYINGIIRCFIDKNDSNKIIKYLCIG